jgi:hypothetical protein
MLPFPSGRSWKRGAYALFFASGIAGFAALSFAQQGSPVATSPAPKSAFSASKIPLPIGHEAKGIVLPDYNLQGQLQARFEAASAKRISEQELQFTGLKVITFTPENTPDVLIDVPLSILDVETRVLTARQRTTVRRGDMNISGDSMTFDTNTREGTFVGNVKMVITGNGEMLKKPVE